MNMFQNKKSVSIIDYSPCILYVVFERQYVIQLIMLWVLDKINDLPMVKIYKS